MESMYFPGAETGHDQKKLQNNAEIQNIYAFLVLSKCLNLRHTLTPKINDKRNRLRNAKLTTHLDLRDNFFQNPLAESSRSLTAFTSTPTRLHELHYFNSCVADKFNWTFPDEYKTCIMRYCDDMLIFTDSSDRLTFMHLVESVLFKLEALDAKIKLTKIQVCARRS